MSKATCNAQGIAAFIRTNYTPKTEVQISGNKTTGVDAVNNSARINKLINEALREEWRAACLAYPQRSIPERYALDRFIYFNDKTKLN